MQVIAMFGVMGNAVLMTQYLQSVLGYSAARGRTVEPAAVGRRRCGGSDGGRGVAAASGGLIVMAPDSLWPPSDSSACGSAGRRLVDLGRPRSAPPSWRWASSPSRRSVTEYAIGVAPAERAGSVSGLVETQGSSVGRSGWPSSEASSAAVYTSRVAVLLPAESPAGPAREAAPADAGRRPVVAAVQAGRTLRGRRCSTAARTAYVDGMHAADLVAAAVLLAGAVVALATMPRRGDVAAAGGGRGGRCGRRRGECRPRALTRPPTTSRRHDGDRAVGHGHREAARGPRCRSQPGGAG